MRIGTDATTDLHTHTLYSDGHWQPAELLAQLAREGIAVAAITDHDTVEHVDELRARGRELGVHLLAGTEVTTSWHGLPAHLLCYADTLTSDALAALIQTTVERQLANSREVYRTLVAERGFAFPRQHDVLRERNGEVVRPVDNALLLVRHGYASDLAHALKMIREAGYVQMTAPLGEAVAAAHASGAVTVLAHPGRGGGEIHRYDPGQIADMIVSVPLDGIEVYYPTHTAAQTAAYDGLARRHGLLVSAGSDSHGPRQRLPVAYPARRCAALLDRCGVQVR
jgi:predicted metal-dependent phosphoesterase TrpH